MPDDIMLCCVTIRNLQRCLVERHLM